MSSRSVPFHPVLFSLVLLVLVLFFLVSGAASPSAWANPVPADDLSIANGFEYYDEHCAQCHGTKAVNETEQWYEPEQGAEQIDFSALIDQAEEARKRKFANHVERDGAGRWAKLPDPGGKANDADQRAQIMAELVAEIDREYGLIEEVDEVDPFSTEYDIGEDLGFYSIDDDDRLPDATDLADPETFFYGTDELELFRSIAMGVGSESTMPAFRARLGSDEAVWDLVNYIRSLWPDEWLD